MSDRRQPPPPSELIYVPGPSWLPVLAAAGLAGLLVGLFAWWPYAVVGAVLLLAALRAWFRKASDDVARLPREQRLSSAVLPAVPLRAPGAGPAEGQAPR
ncbi:MAG: hypothetical protein AUG48_03310 [Actinobacteria bacterium 13_1_20CM_3_68_9]|nr:MAG: hypothetical protein AUG48_03310 [Actinobacteria bacterium 13_1_20CM_3_68_9]